jgi:hypothetical protein
MLNNQLDSPEIRFPIPYSERKNELSPEPFWMLGSANYIYKQDKLARRPGFMKASSGANLPDGVRPDRFWYLQSTEANPSEFLLASCFVVSTSLWSLYAYDLSAETWSTVSSSFSLSASTAPHNCCVSRGRAYVKSYPAASSTDKYGASMISVSEGSLEVSSWGYAGPDKAISVGNSAGFTASSNDVTVLIGWTYSYCYVYGDEPNYIFSNRSPVQTNPTLKSSDTGPFVNAIPRLLIRGDGPRGGSNSQTPIAIFRTTDGGGTFYQLPGGTSNVSATGGVTLTNGSATVTNIWGDKFEHVSGLWNGGSVVIDFYLSGIYHSSYNISTVGSPTSLTLTSSFTGTSANYIYKVNAGSAANTFEMPAHGFTGQVVLLNGDATVSHWGGDTFEHASGLWTNNLVEIDFYNGATYHSTYVIDSTTTTTSLELVLAFSGADGTYNYKVRDFIVEDRYRQSGNTGDTFADPIADSDLDTVSIAPTLFDHSPPPTCLADEGEVIGTATPRKSTPIRSYAGRLWFALGNVLFCSCNEEIALGMPEHAFATGLRGNFWRFPANIANIQDTTEALYIFTNTEVYWLRGKTQETFQVDKLFSDVGATNHHQMAITVADKTVIWLTADYRICMARGSNRTFLSDELEYMFDSFFSFPTVYGIHFARYAERERDWLMVTVAINGTTTDPSFNYTYIFDFNASENGIWLPPIAGPRLQALLHTKTWSSPSMKLYGLSYGKNGSTVKGTLVVKEETIFYDYNPGSATDVDHISTGILNPQRNPAGGHLNHLRLGVTVSDLIGFKIDYDKDEDATLSMEYALDGVGALADWSAASLEDPPRRMQSVGYESKWAQINKSCEYISVKIFTGNEEAEILCLAILWAPNSGV